MRLIMPKISVPDQDIEISVPSGILLLDALQGIKFSINAICGGKNICKKCKVLINGEKAYVCRTFVNSDMTVQLPPEKGNHILSGGSPVRPKADQEISGTLIAIDLGTTTEGDCIGRNSRSTACGCFRQFYPSGKCL